MKKLFHLMVPVAILGLTTGCTDTPTVPSGVPGDESPAFDLSDEAGDDVDVEEIKVEDTCEPASFNAVLGPGACVGDGHVTFGEFVAKLNPADGGHETWRFDPDDTDIEEGQVLLVINEGGEEHTFTEVAVFGGGFVPPLNAALPPGTPPAVTLESFFTTFVAAGGTRRLAGLSVGTHRFQCGIHPWMRTVIEVEEKD